LTFRARVTVKPEVKLGDYKAIKLDREKREVTDADIDRVLENLETGGESLFRQSALLLSPEIS